MYSLIPRRRKLTLAIESDLVILFIYLLKTKDTMQ